MNNMRPSLIVAALTALTFASASSAEELRDFCANRPGKVTPACILDAGHVQIETGIVDAALTRGDDYSNDTYMFGATVLRWGVGRTTELELGWAPYSISHDHGGATTRGVGDISLALRQSLLNPDGKKLSVAVQPFVTAPTATGGQGAGDWTGGVLLPVTLALPAEFQLGATPEIDVLPNSDRGGSHAGYRGVVALSHPLGGTTASVELWASRDDDPGAKSTQASFDANIAWTPQSNKNLQLDAGANAGLNHATPDIELYVGVAARF